MIFFLDYPPKWNWKKIIKKKKSIMTQHTRQDSVFSGWIKIAGSNTALALFYVSVLHMRLTGNSRWSLSSAWGWCSSCYALWCRTRYPTEHTLTDSACQLSFLARKTRGLTSSNASSGSACLVLTQWGVSVASVWNVKAQNVVWVVLHIFSVWHLCAHEK